MDCKVNLYTLLAIDGSRKNIIEGLNIQVRLQCVVHDVVADVDVSDDIEAPVLDRVDIIRHRAT